MPGVRQQMLSTNFSAAADDISEKLPLFSLQSNHAHLFDRSEVRSTGVDRNSRKQDVGSEIRQAGGLLHDVFAGEVIAALLQNSGHGLRDGITVYDKEIGLVGVGRIPGKEAVELLHALVIVPLRIGAVLQIRA